MNLARTDMRRVIVESLPGERGQRLVVHPWWAEALSKLDDPEIRELVMLLPRQAGKSQFLMALAVSEMMAVPDSYVLLVAASEAQQQALYHRKLRRPMERVLDALGQRKAARFTQRGVELVSHRSVLEIVATTADTTPGRTVTLLLVDEARYVPDDVYVALAPSVIGAGGKIVVASTAGPPSGWFYQLVTHPTPESWVYRSDRHDNPSAEADVLDFLRRRLALISPAAARRELHSEFAADGDELLPATLIDAAVDDALGELPSCSDDAYAFVDLSRRRDLTSVVVLVRRPARRPEAGDHLVVASIATWDPRQHPSGEVPFDEVRAHIGRLPQRFRRLRSLQYDEGAEAGTLSSWLRSHPQLSLVSEGFVASAESNQTIWSALAARINGGTISIPRHERLLLELRGLRREEFSFGARWRVVDSSRKFHRDVSFSLAGAVAAAGEVTSCPHCDDEGCPWPEQPLALVGGGADLVWREQHGLLDDEEDDDPHADGGAGDDGIDQLVDNFETDLLDAGELFECGDRAQALAIWRDLDARAELIAARSEADGKHVRMLLATFDEEARNA